MTNRIIYPDYSTVLTSFSSSNINYTATKNCVVTGHYTGGPVNGYIGLLINGNLISYVQMCGAGGNTSMPIYIILKKGQVFSTSSYGNCGVLNLTIYEIK